MRSGAIAYRMLLVLAATIGAGCSAAIVPRTEHRLAGRWQYIQPPDREGEVLDLFVSSGRWRGMLNGLERAGEHGLFYFVAEVERLSVEPGGTIRFEIGERQLFRERPALSRPAGEGNGGVTRYRMIFEGRLEREDLVLRCEDDRSGSCPDDVVTFKKIEDR